MHIMIYQTIIPNAAAPPKIYTRFSLNPLSGFSSASTATTVGCEVGCPEGCPEGCDVGDIVAVGTDVGCPEGRNEGWPLGCPEGREEGSPLGCDEGVVGRAEMEGGWVGVLEGCPVG